MYDSCNSTEFKVTEPVNELKVKSLAPVKFEQKFKAPIDTVSKTYQSDLLCGKATYEIVDEFYEPAPSFITIEVSDDQKEFTIIVDARNLAEPFRLDLFLKAQLVNYTPQVEPFYHDFTLIVEPDS